MSQFEETTEGITVRVESFYLEDQSEPSDDHYVWAYRVEVENNGEAVVQLLTRHWVITDSTGKTQEIRGDGVVGHQPVLEPGQSFEYTSGTPLATPSGFMSGSYQMIDDDGRQFDAIVPAFSLDSPFQEKALH